MAATSLGILMLASENDAIPGAKVGGIGDVIRDLPIALTDLGHVVHVVIPAYGLFHLTDSAVAVTQFSVRFRQARETIEVYRLNAEADETSTNSVQYWLLEHPLFSFGGAGQIYCDDPHWAPFETDANKFALFSQGCAEAIKQDLFGKLDVVHLHDWHTAFYAVLREFDPHYQQQKNLRCVFTLHNLALQGIRPLEGGESALNSWFPWIPYDAAAVSDPRWDACINPVASAIRLCDMTNTVSESYAREIQQPNAIEKQGFHGGEGLDQILLEAASAKRLCGILNGCDYANRSQTASDWPELVSALTSANLRWLVQDPVLHTTHYLAEKSLNLWSTRQPPQHIITSVGRLSAQKISLLTQTDAANVSAVERMLSALEGNGVYILLGTGDTQYEQFFTELAAKHTNFLFLHNFDSSVANLLYASGSLFVMPSSFEPCGISQMLAMKQAQPCLVHAVGGLKDTVTDSVNGFHFSGDSLTQQADHLVERFGQALSIAESDPDRWDEITKSAQAQRFEWTESAQAYVKQLYT